MNSYEFLSKIESSTNGTVSFKSFDSSTQIRRIIISSQENVTFNSNDCINFSPYSPMLASEKALSKTWLLPEEDEAWKDL
jgi:hypothetical protein